MIFYLNPLRNITSDRVEWYKYRERNTEYILRKVLKMTIKKYLEDEFDMLTSLSRKVTKKSNLEYNKCDFPFLVDTNND